MCTPTSDALHTALELPHHRRQQLRLVMSQPQLSSLVLAAHEQLSVEGDEGGVMGPTADLADADAPIHKVLNELWGELVLSCAESESAFGPLSPSECLALVL